MCFIVCINGIAASLCKHMVGIVLTARSYLLIEWSEDSSIFTGEKIKNTGVPEMGSARRTGE